MTEEDVRARMSLQPTPGERRSLADRVLANDHGWTELGTEVDELWQWLAQQPDGS
jgi:dephospho-CoA kinase